MKKLFVLSVFMMISGLMLLGQAPPPPPEDPSNGNTIGPVGGGGAPVGIAVNLRSNDFNISWLLFF